MRVLYVTQWFEPEPVLKGHEFAQLLKDDNIDVRVATGFPNYPSGKIYPGYKNRPIFRDKMGQVSVDRLALYPSHSRSVIGRIVNYLSFAGSLLVYLLFTRRSDVVYVYHPPITAGLAVALACKLRRIPFVLDVQDLWPETLAATGMVRTKAIIGPITLVCQLVYRWAQAIVVLSPGFKRALIMRGVREEKVEVIYNWANENSIRDGSAEPSARLPADRFNIVYAGTMGPAQNLEIVLEAATLAHARDARIKFTLIGDGIDRDRLTDLASDAGDKAIQLMRRIPQAEIAQVLRGAHVLLVHLKKDPLFEITIPSKTQFYMALGKPILMAVDGDAAALVERAGAGICVPAADAAALAEAAVRLAAMPLNELLDLGMQGQAYYYANLSAPIGVRRTVEVLRRATQPR